jgi:hypothetical protein
MIMCNACKAMIDQPPFRDPHGALSKMSVIGSPSGWLERYRCVVCATLLQRVLPKGEARVTELHHWTVV